MKKALGILAALAVLVCGMTGAMAEPFRVGICQLVTHDALDAATQGFMDALTEELGADNVTFDVQNAAGDSNTCSTIVNSFVADSVDLIMANATPALQAASAATADIPILGTSVTEYGVALGIDDFTGTVGGNVCGTSDLAPLDQQAAMILELFPDAKTVGLLYCSAEANSQYQVDTVKKYLEEKGVACTLYPFADSNDVAAVTQTACDASDVIYVPTDNTVAANTGYRGEHLPACGQAGRRRGGRHGQGLRRGDPVHQLLRSGRDHRQDGREDPQGRSEYLRNAHRVR